jgi:hypothetical protein
VVALLLGAGLSAGGFVRVYLSTHSVISASAITASLLFIVLTSGFCKLLHVLLEPPAQRPSESRINVLLHCAGIIMGTVLPYCMAKVSSAGRQCLHPSSKNTTDVSTVEVWRGFQTAVALCAGRLRPCQRWHYYSGQLQQCLSSMSVMSGTSRRAQAYVGSLCLQVVMDVSGVAITCTTCTFVLNQLEAGLGM